MDRPDTGNSGNCNANEYNACKNNPSVSILTSIHRNTILASIGGKRAQCLLDTGATVSCISNAFLSKTNLYNTKLQPTDISEISGVGGERHKILGILKVPIVISSAQFLFDFYVLPELQHPVILGVDFMDAHKVEMDFNKKTVFIKDKLVRTSIMQSDAGLARVHRPTEIPPNSQMNVIVRVSRRKSGDQVLLEPAPSLNTRNLAGAKCMVTIQKRTAVISIINPTDEPVYLPINTVVATVSDVDIDELYPLTEDADENSQPAAHCSNINISSKEELNFDLSNADLDNKQKQILAKFLQENKDVFSPNLENLGKTDLYHHTIEIEPGKGPVRLPFYRQSPHIRAETDKLVNEMLEQGIIEPSNSVWHSPVVLIKKKDNSYRFAVDYRQLNKITRPIAHPLPRLESIFDAIGSANAQYFTTLDLASGFWQIPMDPDSKSRAAFITHDGIYEFNRMPFGLKNAPMSFQMLMSQVLRALNWKHVLCYIDDILVFSKTFDEHLSHLAQVFQRLRNAKLTLKPDKCHFAVARVIYLGHVISKSGIGVDPSKTDAVRTFPTPKNQRDVRSFLGLANFYRRFVKDFSKIATPLNRLLQKECQFIWTDLCQDAFDKLKQALITAPMLHYPNLNDQFCLTTDASDVSLGYILSQKDKENKERVVAYGGRSLRPDERKWTVTEKECLAVVEGIKAYREYLSHRRFTVYTDHKALQWLNNMKDPSNRLGRWALKLQEYQYDIIHKEGKNNRNADALSRRIYDLSPSSLVDEICQASEPESKSPADTAEPPEVAELKVNEWLTEVTFEYAHVPTVSMAHLNSPPGTLNNQEAQVLSKTSIQAHQVAEPSDHADLVALQKECPDFRHLYEYLANRLLPEDATLARNTIFEAEQYLLADNVLYHYYQPRTRKSNRAEGSIIQVALPKSLRLDLLRSYHDSIAGGGHLGIQKTFESIRQKYYWPQLFQNVTDYVLSCDTCQKVKVNRRQPRVPLTNMPITDTFDSWHIDFIGPLPRTKEHSYAHILLVVDRYSRWCESFPMKDQEAKSVARVLFNEIFARYGAPRVLVSDRGPNFMSRLVSALCEMFDITRHHCSSYHPMTNSACERLNSTIAQTLRAYVDKNQQNWADFLPAAMMAFRSSPASATGFSPFHLLFGKEMNLPIDTSLIPKTSLGLDAQHFFEQLLERLKAVKEIAGTNIKISQEKSKQQYDKKAKDPDFKVGDYVLLKSTKVPKGYSPKLFPKSVGPYYITELGPNFTYKLRSCADHIEIKCLINATRLKRYIRPGPIRNEPDKPPQSLPPHQNLPQDPSGLQPLKPNDLTETPKVDLPIKDDQHVLCDRYPARILRHRNDNKQTQYLVRWKDSWVPSENSLKLKDKFSFRVLKKKRTDNITYCLIRWKDTWEPAEICNEEEIQKYNIARAKLRRKKKPISQPRHEYFLRSTVKESD